MHLPERVFQSAPGEKRSRDDTELQKRKRLEGAVILMEYIGDDLSTCLTHHIHRVPNFSKVYGFFASVGMAICDLVSKAYVHHVDMHTENVRVVSKVIDGVEVLRPVFIDFGMCEPLEDNHDIQNIIRKGIQDFYDKLIFLFNNSTEKNRRIIETLTILKNLHNHTVRVEVGTNLYHIINFDPYSKTGYTENGREKHASTLSSFLSKIQKVPAVYFSPENSESKKPVHLVVKKNIYNVIDLDSLDFNYKDKRYKGFKGFKEIIASRALAPLWDGDIDAYRGKYMGIEEVENMMESDMPMWYVVGKLFNGWCLLKDKNLEKQITLLQRNVVENCAFVEDSSVDSATLDRYENPPNF